MRQDQNTIHYTVMYSFSSRCPNMLIRSRSPSAGKRRLYATKFFIVKHDPPVRRLHDWTYIRNIGKLLNILSCLFIHQKKKPTYSVLLGEDRLLTSLSSKSVLVLLCFDLKHRAMKRKRKGGLQKEEDAFESLNM